MKVAALAPAKINLGLEVLSRREDGYHEIRTVLAAVSLFDRITVKPAEHARFDFAEAAGEDAQNIVAKTLEALRHTHAHITPAITLRKRIPVAAGLGGGSSDAAATLIALDQAYALQIPYARLHELASALGSDVPFFLSGGLALGSGRGEVLRPVLPAVSMWTVIVTPALAIPDKTTTLYRSLRTSDFTSGWRMERLLDIEFSEWLAQPETLANAFERPLYERFPGLKRVPETMRSLGAGSVGLSGAGPAHYALETDPDRATWLGRRCTARFQTEADVHIAQLIPHGVLARMVESDAEATDWFARFDHN